jgi:hypothetical protein
MSIPPTEIPHLIFNSLFCIGSAYENGAGACKSVAPGKVLRRRGRKRRDRQGPDKKNGVGKSDLC